MQPRNSGAVVREDPPGVPGGLTCYLLHGVFSAERCRALRAELEGEGFAAAGAHYPGWYRNNDRLVVDHPALAGELFAALRPHLPEVLAGDDGETWELS